MMKNYGLNLELERQHQSNEDWIFGAASLPCIAMIPADDREKYLPAGEVQRGAEDMQDCASRGPINILETKFNWLIKNGKLSLANELWLKANGYVNEKGQVEFSDAFVAINSGTTRQGNSLKAPLEAIRKQGLIPKSLLPLENWMTWDDYHDPKRITPKMINLGIEFSKRITINYEKVYEKDYETLLEKDMIDAAGYAWPEPVNGEYPRTVAKPNHAFMVYNNPKYYIFDNYLDSIDGDFIKKLTSDYDLIDYGYRVLISKETAQPVRENWLAELLKNLWALVTDLLKMTKFKTT